MVCVIVEYFGWRSREREFMGDYEQRIKGDYVYEREGHGEIWIQSGFCRYPPQRADRWAEEAPAQIEGGSLLH